MLLIDTISQALLHSLWQILCIGSALWAALKITPTRHANIRYALCVTCLYLVPASFSVTCLYIQTSTSSLMLLDSGVISHDIFPAILVSAWCLGALFPLIKFRKNYSEITRLRQMEFSPVSEDIYARFQALKSRIHLKHHIQIGISNYVTGPCMLGFWKPIILLPMGCLTQLSSDEVEAIIAHELAHIKRHDALHHILQTIVESLFYYHPVLSYISRQVSIEREHVCDDLAISLIENPKPLATGLLKAGLVQADNAFILPAKSESLDVLESRINRIVSVSTTTNGRLRLNVPLKRAVMALAALFIGLITLGMSSPNIANAKAFSKPMLVSLKDDVCGQIDADNIYWNPVYDTGGPAKIRMVNGQVYMNDAALPIKTQRSLKAIFKNHRLTEYGEVFLRYSGNDIKLIIGGDDKNSDTARQRQVYRLRLGSPHVETFRVPQAAQS